MIVLRILLTLLKLLGIILLCILALVLLLCPVPVGVKAEYSAEGYWVAAKIGPVSLRILPRPPRPKRPSAGEKREKKKKEKEKEKKPKPEEAADAPKKGGNLPMFKELLGLALEAQAGLRRKLKIKELVLCLTIGGGGTDPAKQAILYGRAWAAIGNLWTVLERVFIIKKRDVRAEIDFLTEENAVYARATATITVGAALGLGIRYGIRGLRIVLKHRRRKKGDHIEKGSA